jgi:hypothetical protein
MDLGAILLLVIILVLVGIFLAAPLMRGTTPRMAQDSPAESALMAERDRIINSLQELDFDFRLGKIPEDVYPGQRTSLLQRGAEILQQLDELAPSTSAAGEGRADQGERIEHAVAGRDAAQELGDDKIESMLAARRSARRAKSAGFCPRCGKPVLTSDWFCSNCGKSLH